MTPLVKDKRGAMTPAEARQTLGGTIRNAAPKVGKVSGEEITRTVPVVRADLEQARSERQLVWYGRAVPDGKRGLRFGS